MVSLMSRLSERVETLMLLDLRLNPAGGCKRQLKHFPQTPVIKGPCFQILKHQCQTPVEQHHRIYYANNPL